MCIRSSLVWCAGRKPVGGLITTRWGEAFDRSSPLPEYPRPELVRSDWLCLNGPWDYAIRQSGAGPCVADQIPARFDGQIIVPFALECALSGVNKPLQPDETLWYHRRIDLPVAWAGRKVQLHFEAVDYLAAVFIDGVPLGTHRGAYLPFSFELPALEDFAASGSHELVVAVRDPSDTGLQQRGKQALNPAGILYTATSGIWQTVWLEPLPAANAIHGVRADAGKDLRCVSLVVETGHPATVAVSIAMPDGGRLDVSGLSGVPMYVDLPDPRPWSPADPYLYGFTTAIIEGSTVVDSVESYFALRTIDLGTSSGMAADAGAGKAIGAGRSPVILLNGEPVFLNAVLDQGYWPESGMTPPADEALIFDIEAMKDLGFNTLRKHVKIESRRFYWHADRLGMMVMQDAVSGGKNRAAGTLKVAAAMIFGLHAKDRSRRALLDAGRALQADRDEFEADLGGMVDLLRNHPSIVMWSVFNESWGQFESLRIADDLRTCDATRLIDAVSGWHDQGGGNFRSRHTYLVKLRTPPRCDRRPYFVSEFGGYNLAVPGHMWDDSKRFGYRFYENAAELQIGYENLMRGQLVPLVCKGLRAAVYTQVSDVEIESNGFYTYDRKVLKIDAAAVRALNSDLYAAFGQALRISQGRARSSRDKAAGL